LNGPRFRVIDYKSGNSPILSRALQVPVYALCAVERLKERDGKAWAVDTAAYVAFGQREPFSPVVSVEKTDTEKSLFEARNRVFAVIDNIEQGLFPPSPFKKSLCRSCAFTAVCRKDYVS
jgi:CRISPR/Cas system-associated exonuclease Cas4 (RecB family)